MDVYASPARVYAAAFASATWHIPATSSLRLGYAASALVLPVLSAAFTAYAVCLYTCFSPRIQLSWGTVRHIPSAYAPVATAS